MSQQVWILDDDHSIRWVFGKALDGANISNTSFASADDLLRQLAAGERPMVIVSDVRMPQMDGMQLLAELQRQAADIPVIIMTAHSDLDSAVSAYQGGAFEYLPKPFDVDQAIALVQRALNHVNRQQAKQQVAVVSHSASIIGEAPAMQEVFRAIGRLSRSSISVLINGESGTGKELVAQALHQHSPRQSKAFIALNMAAIPADLIESELFGHEKGAFTGAQQLRKGRFEQANGGTLFLDEIGDMPMDVQTRLLRVLADGQFYRVGGHQPVQVDVRIIAATHQNLQQGVQAGRFREDLYHRLNVIRIQLPSLRQRTDDVPLLARHFLQQAADELQVEGKLLSPQCEAYLSRQSWPGNVRQLQNLCRWLTVMASSQIVEVADLPDELQQTSPRAETLNHSWQSALQQWANEQLAQGNTGILKQAQSEMESILLDTALTYSKGQKQAAAALLGWGRNTLTRKLKRLTHA